MRGAGGEIKRGGKGTERKEKAGVATGPGQGRRVEAGVGGLITTRTRRGAPLRMQACRVVADQEGDL